MTKRPNYWRRTTRITTRPGIFTSDARIISGKWPRPVPADRAARSISTAARNTAISRMIPDHLCQVNWRLHALPGAVEPGLYPVQPHRSTSLEPLPATHVDTGMGFERIVSVLQEVDSNYKTDLLYPDPGCRAGVNWSRARSTRAANFTPYRVIADHARAAAFLIADGVVPGNIGPQLRLPHDHPPALPALAARSV